MNRTNQKKDNSENTKLWQRSSGKDKPEQAQLWRGKCEKIWKGTSEKGQFWKGE